MKLEIHESLGDQKERKGRNGRVKAGKKMILIQSGETHEKALVGQ